TREQADRYTCNSYDECYRILCSAFKRNTVIPYKIGEITEAETEETVAAVSVDGKAGVWALVVL
ncbi:MAG: hypothetical protein MJE68_21445, partial [Proteobacteria bacterium]|nr:hypothetical protein [Pseudomonadota bacterium]